MKTKDGLDYYKFTEEASFGERLLIELGAKKKTTTKKPATKRKPAARKTTTKPAAKRKPSAKKIAEQTFIKSIEDEILNAGRDCDNSILKIARMYDTPVWRKNESIELENAHFCVRVYYALEELHEYMKKNEKNTVTLSGKKLSMLDVHNKIESYKRKEKNYYESAHEHALSGRR
jgi:hypothetical protein